MRYKIFVYTVLIVILIVIQSTLLQYVRIYNVKPNLLLVFVVSVALLRGNVEGSVVGFFAGFSLDMLFGKLLGFYALLGLYLGLAVGSVNKRLYRENYLVVIFFTFLSTVLYEGTVYLLNSIMDRGMDLIYPLTRYILPEAAFNCAVSVFIYALVIRMNNRFDEISKAAKKY